MNHNGLYCHRCKIEFQNQSLYRMHLQRCQGAPQSRQPTAVGQATEPSQSHGMATAGPSSRGAKFKVDGGSSTAKRANPLGLSASSLGKFKNTDWKTQQKKEAAAKRIPTLPDKVENKEKKTDFIDDKEDTEVITISDTDDDEEEEVKDRISTPTDDNDEDEDDDSDELTIYTDDEDEKEQDKYIDIDSDYEEEEEEEEMEEEEMEEEEMEEEEEEEEEVEEEEDVGVKVDKDTQPQEAESEKEENCPN